MVLHGDCRRAAIQFIIIALSIDYIGLTRQHDHLRGGGFQSPECNGIAYLDALQL